MMVKDHGEQGSSGGCCGACGGGVRCNSGVGGEGDDKLRRLCWRCMLHRLS